MVTEAKSATAASANNSEESSTVQTDDDEFSEFISSQWKDGVEVGLVIEYPLPHTNYLQPGNAGTDDDENNAGEAGASSMVGSSIVVGADNDGPAEGTPSTLPPLTLSTVLQEESIAPLFDGTQWAGTRVWKAAVLGLEYLLRERRHAKPQGTRRRGSLLELGCGLGVPGMVWKRVLEAEREQLVESTPGNKVVLTDMDALLSQMQSNVAANFPNDPSIEARALDWSKEGIRSLLDTERGQQLQKHDGVVAGPVFDICLNCDCVYEPLYGREAWESLADVLSEIAQISPETLLVTALERRNGDNVEGFLDRLKSSGMVRTPIQRVVRDTQDPHHVIEIYVTEGKATE